MLTKESIICLKHIVADLENMDVLINSYNEELINQQDKNRYSLVMYFKEYSKVCLEKNRTGFVFSTLFQFSD